MEADAHFRKAQAQVPRSEGGVEMGSVSQAHMGVRGGEREEGERRQSCGVRKLRIKTPAQTCED